MRLKPPALLACIAAACALAACGQTGPLYLPDAGVTTPVEIRTTPTPPPASGPPAEEQKKPDESEAAAGPASAEPTDAPEKRGEATAPPPKE